MAEEKDTISVIEADVIPILERIEANTRTRAYRRRMGSEGQAGRLRSGAAASVAVEKTIAAYLTAPVLAKRERVAKAEMQAARAAEKSAVAQKQAVTAKRSSVRTPGHKTVAAAETKSAEAIQERKERVRAREDRQGLFQSFRQGMKGWSGDFLGDGKSSGDFRDAAGEAVAGLDYTAVKEVLDAFADIDEGSLAGILKKKAEDVLGISKAKSAVEGAKAWAVRKVTGEDRKRSHTRRNAQGQYVSGSARAMGAQKQEQIQENQQEALVEIVDAIRKSDKNAEKRARNIQMAAGGGGGLLETLVGGWFGGKATKALGKTRVGKWMGLSGSVAGKGGGGFLGRMLGGAKSGLGRMLGGIAPVAGKVAAPVAGIGERLLGSAGSVLKGGGKFLGKALGPLTAVAFGLPALTGAVGSGDKKKVGGAVGGIAGGLGGATTGAAIGTALLPGVGTLIGGALGAFAGDFIGEELGQGLGGVIEKLTKAVDENTHAMEGPATGVNWSVGGAAERAKEKVSGAWSTAKRFVMGEKVDPIKGEAGLGGLSGHYESGSRGSSAVGWDSTGGTSYGKYQIATKTGTMNQFMDFLKTENPDAYARLSAAGPADSGKKGAFAQEWKRLASEGALGDSEHEFIKNTHFDPAYNKIDSKQLRDRISKSKALQDVLWSTAVQHGGSGAGGIFNKVYKDGMSEDELVEAVYAERGTRFGSSKPNVRASVLNRFADEKQRALAMLEGEGSETALAQASPSKSAQAVASAVPQEHGRQKPASMREEMAKMQTAATGTGLDTSRLEKKMDELVAINRELAKKDADKQRSDVNNAPNIPMEFDDATLALMAHDRV